MRILKHRIKFETHLIGDSAYHWYGGRGD